MPHLVSLLPCIEQEEEADRMMKAIDALVAEKPGLNLHRVPTMIALRRRDMQAHGIDPVDALRLHRRFRQFGAVNTREGKITKYWVFWVA